MDKNILIEYSDVKAEIKDLRQRIEKNRRELEKLNNTIVTDSVTCGKKGKKPLRTVKIQGRPTMYILRKEKILERNIAGLEKLELELLELTNRVEEYIDSIDKSELRTMFRLYYINNLTWVQVAHRMNALFPKKRIKYTEDSCRMKNKRFFEKV